MFFLYSLVYVCLFLVSLFGCVRLVLFPYFSCAPLPVLCWQLFSLWNFTSFVLFSRFVHILWVSPCPLFLIAVCHVVLCFWWSDSVLCKCFELFVFQNKNKADFYKMYSCFLNPVFGYTAEQWQPLPVQKQPKGHFWFVGWFVGWFIWGLKKYMYVKLNVTTGQVICEVHACFSVLILTLFPCLAPSHHIGPLYLLHDFANKWRWLETKLVLCFALCCGLLSQL